jgi:hypothetical protein
MPDREPQWVTVCPTCNRQATGLRLERHYTERWPLERIWPGGPLVEVRDRLPKMELTANTLSLHPCGCRITWPIDQPAPTIRQIDLNHPDQRDHPLNQEGQPT